MFIENNSHFLYALKLWIYRSNWVNRIDIRWDHRRHLVFISALYLLNWTVLRFNLILISIGSPTLTFLRGSFHNFTFLPRCRILLICWKVRIICELMFNVIIFHILIFSNVGHCLSVLLIVHLLTMHCGFKWTLCLTHFPSLTLTVSLPMSLVFKCMFNWELGGFQEI